jgi:hypothetical protein
MATATRNDRGEVTAVNDPPGGVAAYLRYLLAQPPGAS